MALEIKQGLRLSQSLVMTPQLQQAIKLLQLNRMELMEVVNQELVENPVLEELSETPEGEGSPDDYGEDGTLDPEVQQKRDEEGFDKLDAAAPTAEEIAAPTSTNNEDDINWENYFEEYNNSSPSTPSMKESAEDLPSFESVLTKTTSLEEHILWQLSMVTMSDSEKRLGQLIVGNLGDEGYLNANIEELAKECDMELEDAEEILKMIQHFDPIGVGSRDLKECLLIQASFLKPRQDLVEKMIANFLPELERKNYNSIVKTLGVPLEKVIEATRVIMEFEPKPGRSFQSNDAQYISPDIYVYKVGDEFVINLNEDGLPKLRISPYYKNVLMNAKIDSKSESAETKAGGKETKDYVQDKLRSAVWLIRSIHNRQKTIYKVTDAIVKRQREFFERGVQELKPMILKDVANDIGMHESTISRVTTNKFVHTPVGIYELKYFFNSSINSADGSDSLASEAVKEKLRMLIGKEDPKNPLSDQKIVELLQKENIDIARRTVAKYRDMLGILSSSKRKKVL